MEVLAHEARVIPGQIIERFDSKGQNLKFAQMVMEFKGDLVTVAIADDYGEPMPAATRVRILNPDERICIKTDYPITCLPQSYVSEWKRTMELAPSITYVSKSMEYTIHYGWGN